MSRPGRSVLVQVWDGAVLASFEDGIRAWTVMSVIDDDEAVVLYVGG